MVYLQEKDTFNIVFKLMLFDKNYMYNEMIINGSSNALNYSGVTLIQDGLLSYLLSQQ